MPDKIIVNCKEMVTYALDVKLNEFSFSTSGNISNSSGMKNGIDERQAELMTNATDYIFANFHFLFQEKIHHSSLEYCTEV